MKGIWRKVFKVYGKNLQYPLHIVPYNTSPHTLRPTPYALPLKPKHKYVQNTAALHKRFQKTIMFC